MTECELLMTKIALATKCIDSSDCLFDNYAQYLNLNTDNNFVVKDVDLKGSNEYVFVLLDTENESVEVYTPKAFFELLIDDEKYLAMYYKSHLEDVLENGDYVLNDIIHKIIRGKI